MNSLQPWKREHQRNHSPSKHHPARLLPKRPALLNRLGKNCFARRIEHSHRTTFSSTQRKKSSCFASAHCTVEFVPSRDFLHASSRSCVLLSSARSTWRNCAFDATLFALTHLKNTLNRAERFTPGATLNSTVLTSYFFLKNFSNFLNGNVLITDFASAQPLRA